MDKQSKNVLTKRKYEDSNRDEEYSNWDKDCSRRKQQLILWCSGIAQQTGRRKSCMLIRKKKKRIGKNQDSVRDLGDNINGTNICVIVASEGQPERDGSEQI